MFADPRARPLIRAHGPWWLVSLGAPTGELQVVLAVSAYSTDLQLANGHIVTPPIGGTGFFSLGVPQGVTWLPLAPEEAVWHAARATGRKIASVPELITAPPFAPQLSHWRFALDSAATVYRPDESVPTAAGELYVRCDAPLPTPVTRIRIPARVQPPVDSGTYTIAVEIGQPRRDPVWATLYFTRDSALATRFDDVFVEASCSL